jgi:signal transduction histidine kinase
MQSEQMAAQSESVAASRDTGRNSQDIEDFIYLISHDVRSSVRALLELPNWISEDLEEAGFPVQGQVAASIDLMNRHTSRLDRMLVDLLTFSRIGRMQRVETLSLDVVLDQVLEELDVPGAFDVTRDLKGLEITIGNRDILTLLSALISNAVRHHDKTSGKIHVAALMDGTEVVLTVSDDGPGIAEEFRERIFGAMITLRPRDEVEGSGMGLANVRKIANFYGGTASVVPSVFGKGCCIEVRTTGRCQPDNPNKL